jgi:hypothetical protein
MRLSRKGKAVYAEIGFWLEKNGSIHLTIKDDPSGHVAIFPEPERPNGHRTLFARLAKALAEAGAPSPALDTK